MSPRHFIRLSIAAALAAAPAFAADAPPPPDLANWKCEMCPFDKGYDGSVTVGAAYADGANASYGRYYNGLDHEGAYADLSAAGDYVGDKGRHVEYAIDDAGLSSRRGMVRAGTYGVYDVTLRYDGIPVSRQDATVTPYLGGMTQTLPANWTMAGSPSGMADLESSLHGVRIAAQRRTYSVDGHVRAGLGFGFFARFERQEKTGNQILGAGFLTQAVQLAAPLSYNTDTVEAGIDWSGDRRALRFMMSDSKFHNSDPLLTFQDPYLTLSGNTEFGAVSRPAETDARQWSLTGTTLAPLHSSFSFAAAQTELTNNSPLVPSIAGGIPPDTLYDGKVVLTHFAATVSSQPFANWTARGRASYDERRDDSNTASWQQYLTDQVPSTVLQNPHYGFERSFVDGSIDWRVFRHLSIGIAGDRRDINRTESVVAKTEDGRTYGRARWTPGHGIDVTLKGGFAHRDAIGVDLSRVLVGQDPLVSIYNLSNRDRDFGELSATLAGKTFGLTVQASAANDRYGRSTLGLLSGRERRAAGTFTWTPSDTLSAYVDGGYQNRTSLQAGRYDTHALLWMADIRDRYTHVGAGGHWTLGKWDYTADYTHAKANGDTSVGASGGLVPFPTNQTAFDSYHLTIAYAKSEALTFRVRYAYQNYTAADWAYDGVNPASLSNLLSLGAVVPQHTVNVFAVSFTYRYGKRAGGE
jgi:MtrB/PioB family decaheme-associated outer membrane protein